MSKRVTEMTHLKIERDTLYKIATTAVIENFPKLRGGLDLCPENLLFDVIFETDRR